MNRWTVNPGRVLCFDGTPVIGLSIEPMEHPQRPALAPTVADDLTKRIASLLNTADVGLPPGGGWGRR